MFYTRYNLCQNQYQRFYLFPQITNRNLKMKGNSPFEILFAQGQPHHFWISETPTWNICIHINTLREIT
jgi:hypothetical protein